MTIHKYKDWRGWLDGLRSVAMKTGAEAIVTNLTGWIGSNGVANIGIDFLKDTAMSWKTALMLLGVQFTLRTGLAVFTYIQNKPDPEIISYDTATITKEETK